MDFVPICHNPGYALLPLIIYGSPIETPYFWIRPRFLPVHDDGKCQNFPDPL